jgi:hypothetical protein
MQAHVDKSIHLAFMLLFVHIILFNKLSILNLKVMQIPADMVVNAMIMAMVAHANKSSRIIFHVSSSLRNPMKLI